MFDKVQEMVDRHKQLTDLINDPNTARDREKWQKLCKEHSDLTPIAETYQQYCDAKDALEQAKELLGDKELRELVEQEIAAARQTIDQCSEQLKLLLLPKDPNDSKNVIVEIRGGAGGDEAALFVADLLRMYTMYADNRRWKVDIMNSNPTGIGGFKEVAFEISGNGAYSRFKHESGVHRVQRVPQTESGGRIHTSTVTVAVLPEAEEVEVEINQNDLRVDVFRAGGPGGQCVNTTDSAVRITHLPSGLVVSCQDEKSQHKNKDKAMKILRSRLYDLRQSEQHEKIAGERRAQVGTGDRNERIRTYNFPQGRVTDHRINLTLYKLDAVLNGELDEIIDALITHYQVLLHLA